MVDPEGTRNRPPARTCIFLTPTAVNALGDLPLSPTHFKSFRQPLSAALQSCPPEQESHSPDNHLTGQPCLALSRLAFSSPRLIKSPTC